MFDKFKDMARPLQLMQQLMKQDAFRALLAHPNVQTLLRDPELNQLVTGRDLRALFAHPKLAALMQDPDIASLMAKLDLQSLRHGPGSCAPGRCRDGRD